MDRMNLSHPFTIPFYCSPHRTQGVVVALRNRTHPAEGLVRKRAVPAVSEEEEVAASVSLSAGLQVTSGELHSDSRFTVSTHRDISVQYLNSVFDPYCLLPEYNLVPNKANV